MSIPPLVCSTPPPPDQCEDEKEPVDFDLSYHLSQDEDEEDAGNSYGFSSYSKYDHYSSPLPESNSIDIPVNEVKNDIGIENNVTNTPQQSKNVSAEKTSEEINIDINIESKLNSEDDMNIEDLDLKIDQESTVINDKEVIEDNIVVSNAIVDCSNKNSHTYYPEIPDIGQDDQFTPPESGGSEECSIEEIKNSDKIENLNTLNEAVLEISENLGQETIIVESNMPQSIENIKDDQPVLNKIDHMGDDDFGDFEENVIPTCKSSVVLDDKNPWENDETGSVDFGKFEANFDENTNICNPPLQIDNSNDNIVHVNETENNSYEDDDFGDFDDFQSSTIETRQTEEDISCQQMSVLELHSPDNESQAIESINKILFTIFKDDISESDCEFDGKLESLLCETWGHLLDTDVRQPYVVNWNNSLGQQTLLKSLCIDSRNILYGPKWTSGMPKYAANLTSAPLQPQKQPTQANVNPNEPTDVDKCSAKTGTWSDPFISDGQESCNKEPQNAQSTTSIPTRPSTLDVFEDPSIPRSDKIFSNTINIQPMRQINLPDTHIFTPTDSETPRSKTIHYDSSPAVLRPQTKENNISDNLSANNETEDGVEDFDDYSEFQDFKGASEHVKPIENEKINVTNIPKYETQILQPIKVEPIMPTLNWPDPGHVKETFDDFSDFVSSSSWPGDKQESIKQETPEIIQEQMTSNVSKEEFDDGFDTFQSAPTSVCNNLPLDTRVQNNESISVRNQTEIPKHIPKNNVFTTADRKADPISRVEISNDVTVHSQTHFTPNNIDNNTNKTGIVSPPINQSGVSILQPMQASTLHNQSKSTQILQPLSLESFSQINWPNPGIDLQDLSRFNPVETLSSLKIDSMSNSKSNSPAHIPKPSTHNQTCADDDIWGEFVSSKPSQKKQQNFVEDDEWTDFVSSPSIKPQNGLNTISFNVHTNSSVQLSNQRLKSSQQEKTKSIDIPTLNYITPKSNNHSSYKSRHFQNL